MLQSDASGIQIADWALPPLLEQQNQALGFVSFIVAHDPKIRTMLAIMQALSPGEADAWLEVRRRMARAPVA